MTRFFFVVFKFVCKIILETSHTFSAWKHNEKKETAMRHDLNADNKTKSDVELGETVCFHLT